MRSDDSLESHAASMTGCFDLERDLERQTRVTRQPFTCKRYSQWRYAITRLPCTPARRSYRLGALLKREASSWCHKPVLGFLMVTL